MNRLSGFSYFPNFVSQDEEQQLIQEFQNFVWQEVALFGQKAKRRVVHFGMNYNYDRRTVQKTQSIPPFLNEIQNRTAMLLNVHPEKIAEVLIIEYPISAGIGWHRDAAVFDVVCGISLNSSTVIHLRKREAH